MKKGVSAMSMAKIIEWLCDSVTVCVVRVRGVKIYQQGFADTKSGLAYLGTVRAYFVEPVEGKLWDWMKITKYPSPGVADESEEHAAVEKGKVYAFDLATLGTENGLKAARMGHREPFEVQFDAAPAAAPQGAADGAAS
jgi:hypothetical protein